MAFIKKSKNVPICFALGAFCLFYGLARTYIENRLTALEIALFLISLACFLTCALSFRDVLLNKGRKPGLIKESLGLKVFLATFLWILINFFATQYKISFDATEHKQHTLSRETILLVKDLKQNIRLSALHVGLAPKYLEDLLSEYEAVSDGKITTEIIDPLEQIGYASQFGQVIKGKEKKIIAQSGTGRDDIDFSKEPLNEELINNALLRVTRPERQACFLTGHGEYRLFDKNETGLSIFAKLLTRNNILVQEFSITITGGIPKACNVIVIAGPKEQYSEKEEAIIKDYLAKGGDALFMLEHTVITTPDAPLTEDQINKNPSLNSILVDWGVRVNSDIVVDISSHASGDVGSPATRNYPQHKSIISGLDYTFYVRPRSISVVPERKQSVRVAPLVLTASAQTSWGETNRMLDVKYDGIEDRPGPVPIAFVIWEPRDKDKKSDTRIVVFTDADFASNTYIEQLSNAQMALNVVNWISELDYKVFNVQKKVEVAKINLISSQKRLVAAILWALPFAIIAFCGMYWLKRKISE